MRKCATCDFEYDDACDGCPKCAKVAVAAANAAPGVPVAQVLSSGKPDYGPGGLAGAPLVLPAFFTAYVLAGVLSEFGDWTAA